MNVPRTSTLPRPLLDSVRTDLQPPLLTDPSLISDRLKARSPALFLDYDGTLTPIVDRPEDARIAAPVRDALRDAAAVMPVAIVSGRDLDDVQRLVALDDLIYAGSHGFDIRGPDLCLELPEGVDALEDLDEAASRLDEQLADVAGALVERKRFAIAVHYRRVADSDVARVDEAVAETARMLPALRRTGGKKVFELRPAIDWNKGRAVLWLLAQLGLDGPDVLPIYVGDDDTDEDAFRALAERGGIGVLVAAAPRLSSAAFRLPDTEAVGAFIGHLTESERLDT